jgi:CRISPR system Cascade subunit CasD
MPQYLILRLDGPMQAWGTHTFEDYRPVNPFPTRSGLLGLLGACLGIDRRDSAGLRALAESVEVAERIDASAPRPEAESEQAKDSPPKPALKQRDFHTVLRARKVDGSTNKYPVVSEREYLFEAAFTVAIGARADAAVTLASIALGLRRPAFTPSLGRRSCPLARPLLETPEPIEATDAKAALAGIAPVGGPIYTEGDLVSDKPLLLRDVPNYGDRRQFNNRRIYLHREDPS